MQEKQLLNTGKIPLLAAGKAGKHYFAPGESGRLQYFLDKKGDGCWVRLSENILRRNISGFDMTADRLGNTHLLGYDGEGSIFHLCLPPGATEELPPCSMILKEEGKQILGLAICADNAARLHLLYLAWNGAREKWWLFYLRREDGRWLEKEVLDFGCLQPEQYGTIFSDSRSNLFLLHRLYEENGYTLVLRAFGSESGLPGQTLYLGDQDHYCYFPDVLATPDNALHISWISRKNNILFLNYARRNPRGEWDNRFCNEIPPGSAPLAFLYFIKGAPEALLLTWQNNGTLFYLLSRDGGAGWEWGAKVELEDTCRLIRLRREPCLLNDPVWLGNYTFSRTSPPETYLRPEMLLRNRAEEGGVSGKLETLDLLASRLLSGYENLQSSNAFLKQKIAHQKEEMAGLYSTNLAKAKVLEGQLASKNIEITKMKGAFQNTIDELKAKISGEREELAAANHELQRSIKALKEEIEKRRKTNLLLRKELTVLQEEIKLLKKENERLQKKSIGYYLQKLLPKNRR